MTELAVLKMHSYPLSARACLSLALFISGCSYVRGHLPPYSDETRYLHAKAVMVDNRSKLLAAPSVGAISVERSTSNPERYAIVVWSVTSETIQTVEHEPGEIKGVPIEVRYLHGCFPYPDDSRDYADDRNEMHLMVCNHPLVRPTR
jgi:hypothetical protein